MATSVTFVAFGSQCVSTACALIVRLLTIGLPRDDGRVQSCTSLLAALSTHIVL